MYGNTEIVRKVIEKALDNGWKHTVIHKIWDGDKPISSIDFAVRESQKHMNLLIGTFLQNPNLFFDHDFAKAFWGSNAINKFGADLSYVGTDKDPLKELAHAATEDDKYISGVDPNGIDILEAWQYHLQQMVLEEDPIQYLAKFL